MEIQDCKFNYKQIHHFNWVASITNPEGLTFSINFQHPPVQPNESVNQAIFNELKNNPKNFILELQENKDWWIIKDEIKPEIKEELKVEEKPIEQIKEEIKNEPDPQ